jgi:hypothetical protein
MIPAVILFSLAAIWLGGVFYATGYMVGAYIATALGAGWLGIIYSALLRLNQEMTDRINRENA